MKKLYRFSPIENERQLIGTVKYIATYTSKLCKKILGKELRITSLTVFSHYPDEYQTLIRLLNKLGELYDENNGPRVVLKEPIIVSGHTIKYLRVRKPDPYRMQVGCNDFDVEDYSDFKKKNLTEQAKNMRVVNRTDYEMIEFFDPDFDVLAYVVSRSADIKYK